MHVECGKELGQQWAGPLYQESLAPVPPGPALPSSASFKTSSGCRRGGTATLSVGGVSAEGPVGLLYLLVWRELLRSQGWGFRTEGLRPPQAKLVGAVGVGPLGHPEPDSVLVH